ncbi:MAG: T9SS type A sorting domain-containing protein [Bacteroidetes bacterium]|nr:T9SS type A sorting domain-containing protein [Bacteroidota bacterium]
MKVVIKSIFLCLFIVGSLTAQVYKNQWGVFGGKNGEFSTPQGIAVDAADNMYIVDQGNNRIQKFDSKGSYLLEWKIPVISTPSLQGIAVDATGYVYVFEGFTNQIYKFDATGAYKMQWGNYGSKDGEFSGAKGLAVDGAGNVYVADAGNNRIQCFDSEGKFLLKWGNVDAMQGPTGIAVSAGGDVYVTDAIKNEVQMYKANGAFLLKWGVAGSKTGEFNGATGIAVDAAGDVCVVDNGNSRVQKFSSKGDFILEWGTPGTGDGNFSNPYGIGFNKNGDAFITDDRNNRVQVFCFAPAHPGIITGALAQCAFAKAQSYSVNPVLGANSYMWTVPKGWTIISGNGTTKIFVDAGNVGDAGSISVSAVNACGTGISSFLSVAVNPNPIAPVIPDQAICAGDPAAIFDAGTYFSYSWGDNGTGATQTTTGTIPGKYTCTVSDKNGCMAKTTAILKVNALPTPSIADKKICFGDPVATFDAGLYKAYLWSNKGFGTSRTTTGSSAGNYTCTVTDTNGCKATATGVLTVNGPVVSPVMPDQTICAGDTAIFDAGVYATYAWSSQGTGTARTTKGTKAGTYICTVKDVNGCQAAGSAKLTVNPLPVVSMGALSDVCKSAGAVLLSGGSPIGGVYSGLGVVGNNFDPSVALIGKNTITYTYTDVNKCKDSKTTTINVTNRANIHGTVTYGVQPVKVGVVLLFADSTANNRWDQIRSATINNDGTYAFDGVLPRKYILRAVPDAVTYPKLVPTLQDGKFDWNVLSAIDAASCVITTTDISVIQLLADVGGSSSVSGYVYSDGTLKTNDPIPGLDIILDKIPPSQSVQKTTTDANGHYVFNNLSGGTYKVKVDIVGVGVSSLYTVDLGANDTSNNSLNYCIQNSVNICSVVSSVANVDKGVGIEMWPNPANTQVNIQLPQSKSAFGIEVYDVLGKQIFAQNKLAAGNNISIDISTYLEGMYIVKISSENSVIDMKLMKQ